MADLVDRLWALVRHGRDRGMKMNDVEDAAREIKRLRDRLGPRGLEVVEIDGAGHYVNEKVKAEIERLREENRHFRAAIVAAMTTSSVSSNNRGTD